MSVPMSMTLATFYRNVPIVYVMNFVENDPFQVSDDIASVVQHRPKNLGGHNQARGFLVDLYVARDEAHVLECRLEVAKFLIGERLNRRRVNSWRE